MGCDTNSKLIGHIYPEQIFDFVKNNFDPNATMKSETTIYDSIDDLPFVEEVYDDSGLWKTKYGYIYFTYKNENRKISYFYDNINSYDNLDYYTEKNLADMVKAETTYISLGSWGASVEIIKAITSYFGGWLDENDCDDKDPYWIKGSHSVSDKDYSIIHVTRDQLNEKFGGVVVIDN